MQHEINARWLEKPDHVKITSVESIWLWEKNSFLIIPICSLDHGVEEHTMQTLLNEEECQHEICNQSLYTHRIYNQSANWKLNVVIICTWGSCVLRMTLMCVYLDVKWCVKTFEQACTLFWTLPLVHVSDAWKCKSTRCTIAIVCSKWYMWAYHCNLQCIWL